MASQRRPPPAPQQSGAATSRGGATCVAELGTSFDGVWRGLARCGRIFNCRAFRAGRAHWISRRVRMSALGGRCFGGAAHLTDLLPALAPQRPAHHHSPSNPLTENVPYSGQYSRRLSQSSFSGSSTCAVNHPSVSLRNFSRKTRRRHSSRTKSLARGACGFFAGRLISLRAVSSTPLADDRGRSSPPR